VYKAIKNTIAPGGGTFDEDSMDHQTQKSLLPTELFFLHPFCFTSYGKIALLWQSVPQYCQIDQK
jgi:hypothetical protein